MEQHSIPRQMTTFEFKLIGFLTLKQFIYLVIFVPIAFIVYKIFPIPLLNYVFAFLVVLLGLGLAFVPINDRPMDIWIKSFFNRLISPTQYTYQKHDEPISFLNNLIFLSDPHRVLTHIESQEKLAAYLATKNTVKPDPHKQNVHTLLHTPNLQPLPPKPYPLTGLPPNSSSAPSNTLNPIPYSLNPIPYSLTPKQPFFTGIIKNHRLIPLPGILIYVKDEKGEVLRLLKTNPHGVFATFNPLPVAEYTFEIKDTNNTYFFDTMKIKVENINPKPFEFMSKELM